MSDRAASGNRRVCEVWHIRIGEDPLPSPTLEVLSPDERQRAARFVRETDRRRFQLCHAALRHILGEWLGEAPERLRFVTGRWGKPALDQPFAAAGLEFNLSHAAGLGLVAVTRGRCLGIDVEAVRRLKDMAGIARRVLAAGDYEVFAGLPPEQAVETFWRAWTANEACLKAVGSGLGSGERAIRLDRDVRPVPCDARLHLHRLELESPFVGALAVEGGEDAAIVRREFHLQPCA
jgi:4'-phosphopantetheinyl transferase